MSTSVEAVCYWLAILNTLLFDCCRAAENAFAHALAISLLRKTYLTLVHITTDSECSVDLAYTGAVLYNDFLHIPIATYETVIQ